MKNRLSLCATKSKITSYQISKFINEVYLMIILIILGQASLIIAPSTLIELFVTFL